MDIFINFLLWVLLVIISFIVITKHKNSHKDLQCEIKALNKELKDIKGPNWRIACLEEKIKRLEKTVSRSEDIIKARNRKCDTCPFAANEIIDRSFVGSHDIEYHCTELKASQRYQYNALLKSCPFKNEMNNCE